MKDPYKTLNVDKDATEKEIKKAYRKKAKETHPDKKEDKDATEFNEVSTAYMVLSNPIKRKEFDETGSVDTDSVSEEERNLTMAIERFISCFMDSVSKTPFDELKYKNIIEGVRIKINEQVKAIDEDIKNAEGLADHYTKIKDKVNYKGDKDDFLSVAIDQQIQGLKTLIETKEKDSEVWYMSLSLCDQYEWLVEHKERSRDDYCPGADDGFSFESLAEIFKQNMGE